MERRLRSAGAAQHEVALKLSRWITIAALTCLLVAVAYLPPQPGPDRYTMLSATSSEEARLDLINRARQRTDELLASLRSHDSLRAAVRAAGTRTGGVTLAVEGAVRDDRRRTIRGALEHVWQQAHGPNGTGLLVRLELSASRRYITTYALPQALDGRTCAVSLTIDPTIQWVRMNSVLGAANLESVLLESLGPCLYYTAFGPPGPQIERWLQERSFKLANSANWNGPPPQARWQGYEEQQLVFSNMSFDALACTAGRLERCRPAIEHTNKEENFRVRPAAARVAGVFQRSYWPRNFLSDDFYLSSLVREMGRDRFAQFWHSTAPVDSAFAAAFGQSIETWTSRWARGFTPELKPFGPAPRPIAVLFALAMAAVAIAGVGAGVMRRQVG